MQQAPEESFTTLDLSKAYRSAFEEFSRRVQRVQQLTAEENPDVAALDAALIELEQARLAYNTCRDALARHLLSSPTAHTHGDRVKRMAELLWEVEGRPDGTADKDWHRAEEIVRHLTAA
jgi:exonuclease VII small subunit